MTARPIDIPFHHLSKNDQAHQINSNKQKIDVDFDLDFMKALVQQVIEPMDKAYFRSRYIGFDKVEERKAEEPATIFFSNHSGMAFPWDGMLMCARTFQKNQYNFSKFLRPLIAPVLSSLNILNPFMIRKMWKRVGSVDATFLNFETLMQQKETHLLVYPEGIKGIGKGFDKKYQVQKFASSFVRLACKYQTAVCPIFTVNAEYINPYTYIYKLTNYTAKKTGLPFLPVGFMLPFLVLFPWLFYYSWPARITYIKGKLFKPWELIGKKANELTEKDISEIVALVQQNFQQQLNSQVEKYGQKAIEWKHYFKNLLKQRKYFPLTTPFGWPVLFAEFERRYQQQKKYGTTPKKALAFGWLSFFSYLLKNPFYIFFYIPILGWIPLWLKGFKKPARSSEK